MGTWFRLDETKPLIPKLLAMLGPIAVARIVSLTLGAIQLPILTRQLPPQDYAIVAAAIAIAVYVSLIAGDPITLGFQRFPGSNSKRQNYNYSSARLGTSFIVTAVAALLVTLFTQDVSATIGVVGWAFGLAGMRFTSMAWLMWQRPWMYTFNLGTSSLIRTVTLLVAIGAGVEPLASLGLAGLMSFLVAITLGPRPRWRRQVLKSPPPWPRGTGLALAIGSFGTTVLLTLDKILIPVLTDGESAGRYAAMNQVVSVSLGAVLTVVSTAIAPRALALWTSGRQDEALNMNALVIHVSAIIGAISGLFIMSGGYLIIGTVLGPGYTQPVLATGLASVAVTYVIGQQASWAQRYQLRFKHVRNAALAGASVAIILIPLATLHAGVIGTMLATATGTTVYTLLMLWKAQMGSRSTVITLTTISTTGLAAMEPHILVLAIPFVATLVISLYCSIKLSRLLTFKNLNPGSAA